MVRTIGYSSNEEISDLDLYQEAKQEVQDKLLGKGVKVPRRLALPPRYKELLKEACRVRRCVIHLDYTFLTIYNSLGKNKA